jgi:hypothetical protein
MVAILRSDLDGKSMTIVVPPGGTFTPKQLQLEKESGKLYCTRKSKTERPTHTPAGRRAPDGRGFMNSQSAGDRPGSERPGGSVAAGGGSGYQLVILPIPCS